MRVGERVFIQRFFLRGAKGCESDRVVCAARIEGRAVWVRVGAWVSGSKILCCNPTILPDCRKVWDMARRPVYFCIRVLSQREIIFSVVVLFYSGDYCTSSVRLDSTFN